MRGPGIALACVLVCFAPLSAANAAVIGVLNDGRQVDALSLIDQLSAARVALESDGHTIVELGAGSLLALSALETVDIVWLPLLQTTETYTSQERTNLSVYAFGGGRVVWIGDADVYNTADDSFLTAFGLSKRVGNFGIALAPALPDHPAVSGPHGVVNAIGTNASYGLFDSIPDMADVFVNDPGPGTLVGLMDERSGYNGLGRLAFVCDATMFSQLLLQDDHQTLLRNIVKWAEAGPAYTPSGNDVDVGQLLLNGCGACSGLNVVFSEVVETGETTANAIGSGRCHFSGIAFESLPADFVGVGFNLETTATLGSNVTVSIALSYDSVALAALGIADETSLRLYQHVAGANINVTTQVDTVSRTIFGVANSTGTFLFGASLDTPDCNNNSTPDVCEIDAGSSAPGGPFECTNDCDPDCNNNGVPDACDIASSESEDCNGNNVPDDCEATVNVTLTANPPDGGTVTPDGTMQYPICTNISIEANPVQGRCLSSWSVDVGAAPVDVDMAQTTVIADENKTVTANFVEIIVQQPTGVSVCEDDAAIMSIEVHAGLVAEASYQWLRGGVIIEDNDAYSGAATHTLTIDPVADEHAAEYTCTVTLPCGTATSEPATLTLLDNTQIVTNPEDRFACPNDTVQFQVEAIGVDVTYQWQRDIGEGFVDLVDGGAITGSLASTLILANLTSDAAGFYRCVAMGTCGDPVTSNAAELMVGEDTAILSSPDDATVCPGDSVAFAISAAGTNLAYQWRFDDGSGAQNLVDNDNINGATTATLIVSDIEASHAGTYDCFVTGDCSSASLSLPATLTVSALPQILSEPTDQSACPGSTVAFAVTAVGSGLAYQWQFDGGSGFGDLNDTADLSGATTSILTVTNLDNNDAGAYRCTVSGDCGLPVTSEEASLHVLPVIAIITQPSVREICPGEVVTFQIAATGTDLSYQWQFNDGPAFESLVDGDGISGANTDTLTIASADEDNAGLYQCVVTDTCGPAQVSDTAQLNLLPGLCDCNSNGVPDADDLANGTSQDCNENDVPDSCDLDEGNGLDCNNNGVPDECDIDDLNDCNENGIPDECEPDDCNADSIPDVCQLEDNDCNGNGRLDECEPPYVADAGPDVTLCVNQISLPLGGSPVASGSTPPYGFLWSVNSGPEGGGEILSPTSERARFRPTLPGTYEIEVLVSDSSLPPCTTTDVLVVSVYDLSVDAGADFSMCDGATSTSLSPIVIGGAEPIEYEWTIESGSPSTDISQFTGAGQHNPNPTFTPVLPGEYTLRLTVTDTNNPGCIRSDTLTVNVILMTMSVSNDFSMCVNAESDPLEVVVTSPGTPPYSYNWSIDAGSPDVDVSQFGGNGTASTNPTFAPTSAGVYVLRVTVQDSSTPPCEVTATIRVTTEAMTVDAGASTAQCVGGDGIRLSPVVNGGSGNLIYTWTIEAGPSLDLGQFSDPHSFHVAPLFTPDTPGNYALRLTVTDSGTPACAASDTVTILGTSMSVDIGEPLVVQALQASQPLGIQPVVTGGDPPYSYDWSVLAGPELTSSQFSATDTAHPKFTPAAVGTYALEVSVTDANGAGCTIKDQVTVEAIAATLVLRVNGEGRLFMPLRIDEAFASCEVRMAMAEPGIEVVGELYDAASAANFNGLIQNPMMTRRLSLNVEPTQTAYSAVVIMRYAETELASPDEEALQLHWWDEQQGVWRPAADGTIETGTYPARPTLLDVGRQGVDRVRNEVWAVVDYAGEFSIGISNGVALPVAGQTVEPETIDVASPMCGAVGSGTVPLMLVYLTRVRRKRRL